MENQDKQLAELEHQLRNSIAAEEFFKTEPGRLFTELATKKINQLNKAIISDKFLKDHSGYVNAVCELRAYKEMLRRLQLQASPALRGKIDERLEDARG